MEETNMRLIVATLTVLAALSLTFAPADAAHKRHHRANHSVNSGNPNGTAGGPTTLSGTGSSQFGGSSPGTTGKN
jgi:hypothetical protein